jgi:hypothetical protein
MKIITLLFFMYFSFSFSEKDEIVISNNVVDLVESSNYNAQIHGYYAHATPETFGYTGFNEIIDNAALQASFDSTLNLTLSGNYNTSVTLYIDTILEQTINGTNNATITATATLQRVLEIDFRGDNNPNGTTVSNLTVNGNSLGGWLIFVYSKVQFDNVDAANGLADNSAGLYINVYNEISSWGDWLIKDSNITNIVGNNNGILTDSIGVSSSLLFYAQQNISTSNPTNIVFENLVANGSWSEDSQILGLFSPSLNTSNSGLTLTFSGGSFQNSQRRVVKGFMGNVIYDGCSFFGFDVNHPNYDPAVAIIATMVLSADSGATGASNIIVRNCNFFGDDNNVQEEIDELILNNVGDVVIQNCNFLNGSDLEFGGTIGNITVCGTFFGAGSRIGLHFNQQAQASAIIFDTSNTYTDPSPFSTLPYAYEIADIFCPPQPPTQTKSSLFGF